MAGAPGRLDLGRSSTPFTTNTFTTRGAPEVPGPHLTGGSPQPCASPSRCSQPECWPQPSSGRRAPRRRPRRPRRPRRRPAARPAARPRVVKAGPDTPEPDRARGASTALAVATAVIGNVVYVGGAFNNAVSPTGATAAHANLAAFCLADGSAADTLQRPTSTAAPVNALATDGANLFVGGNFTTLNGAAVEPPGQAQRQTGAATPASHRSPSRPRCAAPRPTASWPWPTPERRPLRRRRLRQDRHCRRPAPVTTSATRPASTRPTAR